jgi:hypothetical protein
VPVRGQQPGRAAGLVPIPFLELVGQRVLQRGAPLQVRVAKPMEAIDEAARVIGRLNRFLCVMR